MMCVFFTLSCVQKVDEMKHKFCVCFHVIFFSVICVCVRARTAVYFHADEMTRGNAFDFLSFSLFLPTSLCCSGAGYFPSASAQKHTFSCERVTAC